MRSAELAETALSIKNMTFDEEDSWTTFEVIENGELGTGRRVLTSPVWHLEFKFAISILMRMLLTSIPPKQHRLP